MKEKKRTFGILEVVFDIAYLCTVFLLGGYLLATAQGTEKTMFGAMTLVLAFGDTFHLVPRIAMSLRGKQIASEKALGIGKMLTSMGMTVFYILLWQVGISHFHLDTVAGWSMMAYVLAGMRIMLCLMPQNGWGQENPPEEWNWYRNIPFILLGAMVGILFFLYRRETTVFPFLWIGVFLSFAFYLPVVFGARKRPMLGMLMLPKSCVYIWMITMGLQL